MTAGLGAATVRASPVTAAAELFCIGNPSNIDLEALSARRIEFTPATWHLSAGACEGYESAGTHALREAIAARGRPPTRGELQQVATAASVGPDDGVSLRHTCWTYW